jgi:hypothetical protein
MTMLADRRLGLDPFRARGVLAVPVTSRDAADEEHQYGQRPEQQATNDTGHQRIARRCDRIVVAIVVSFVASFQLAKTSVRTVGLLDLLPSLVIGFVFRLTGPAVGPRPQPARSFDSPAIVNRTASKKIHTPTIASSAPTAPQTIPKFSGLTYMHSFFI